MPSNQAKTKEMKAFRSLCLTLVLIAGTSLSLGGCGGKVETRKMPEVSDGDMNTAREYFGTYCSTCHGKDGRGDGAEGADLKPKPRDFHDAAWRKKATWERVHLVISKGGAAAGLSPSMAPAPLYQDKPGVLNALTKLCLDFGQE